MNREIIAIADDDVRLVQNGLIVRNGHAYASTGGDRIEMHRMIRASAMRFIRRGFVRRSIVDFNEALKWDDVRKHDNSANRETTARTKLCEWNSRQSEAIVSASSLKWNLSEHSFVLRATFFVVRLSTETSDGHLFDFYCSILLYIYNSLSIFFMETWAIRANCLSSQFLKINLRLASNSTVAFNSNSKWTFIALQLQVIAMSRLSKGDPSSFSEPGTYHEPFTLNDFFFVEHRRTTGSINKLSILNTIALIRWCLYFFFFLPMIPPRLMAYRKRCNASRWSVLECWLWQRNHKWRSVVALWYCGEGSRANCESAADSVYRMICIRLHILFCFEPNWKIFHFVVVISYIFEQLLDVSELTIEEVAVKTEGGKIPVNYVLSEHVKEIGAKLTIDLPTKTSGKLVVSIVYRTSPQASGLQWLKPEQTQGKKHPYMYSQCQAIHARSIVPCQDTGAVKFTFRAEVKHSTDLTALLSGVRVSGENGKTVYEQTVPIPAYLLAIAVGPLVSRKIGPM